MQLSTRLVLVVSILSTMQLDLSQQAKKKVETTDQLPVHSYPVSGKASDLLNEMRPWQRSRRPSKATFSATCRSMKSRTKRRSRRITTP